MSYDVITVGGGLGGSALAVGLARHGFRVLVLERETAFRDRVRGEEMHCWGVAEARALGLYELLKQTCARENRYWSVQMYGAESSPPRDLVRTSPHACGSFGVYHPAMQKVLLGAAAQAGASVRRGAQVIAVAPGKMPSVRVREGGREQTYAARLAVGADGRESVCRVHAGFEVRRDPDGMLIAGVMLTGATTPDDLTALSIRSKTGQLAIIVPVGSEHVRAYVATFPTAAPKRMTGAGHLPIFVQASVAAGLPAEWLERAEVAGPLACFDGTCRWVDHPYRRGVTLIGDAAGATDPTFGCGLSLTLRDVRVLRDRLLAGDDWDIAAEAYAAEHDLYFAAIHRLTGWMRRLLYDPSPQAEGIRARALPLLAEEPWRRPDLVGIGPEFSSDERARQRLFGEI